MFPEVQSTENYATKLSRSSELLLSIKPYKHGSSLIRRFSLKDLLGFIEIPNFNLKIIIN